MGVDRTRKNGHEHHTVVTNGRHPGDGQVRILVADDHMLVDSEDHTGAGVAYRRMSQALLVGAEVVNPEIPRHDGASVRRSAGFEPVSAEPPEVQRVGAVDREPGVLSCPFTRYSWCRRER